MTWLDLAGDIERAIHEFKTALPGWWFSVGACSVSRDASCAPDRTGCDAHLLSVRIFDDGFHADLREPDATLADALRYVTREAIAARNSFITEVHN